MPERKYTSLTTNSYKHSVNYLINNGQTQTLEGKESLQLYQIKILKIIKLIFYNLKFKLEFGFYIIFCLILYFKMKIAVISTYVEFSFKIW